MPYITVYVNTYYLVKQQNRTYLSPIIVINGLLVMACTQIRGLRFIDRRLRRRRNY